MVRVVKIVKKATMSKNRWGVIVYLDKQIKWDKLLASNGDVEYDPEAGDSFPMIKTSAGTICYLRKTITIRNPHDGDISPLVRYALNKLDGRKLSHSWFEFQTFWRKEVRELDDLEKMMLGKK